MGGIDYKQKTNLNVVKFVANVQKDGGNVPGVGGAPHLIAGHLEVQIIIQGTQCCLFKKEVRERQPQIQKRSDRETRKERKREAARQRVGKTRETKESQKGDREDEKRG